LILKSFNNQILASNQSYTLTLENNKSEKEAIDFLMSVDSSFICPDKSSRKKLLELFKIDPKYARAFDLIIIPGHTNLEEVIHLESLENVTFVELKTTKKKLPNLPKGFFFGATQSEFDVAKLLGDKYLFCFVSLHPESMKYALISLEELNKIIRTKRIQYQINL
jgi:hypothetical protein